MWNIFWVQVFFFAKKVTFLLENLKIFLFFDDISPQPQKSLRTFCRTSNFLVLELPHYGTKSRTLELDLSSNASLHQSRFRLREGMVSDKNFASRVEFEFTICESSRAELSTASCESSRAASCRVELSSIIDEVQVFFLFRDKKNKKNKNFKRSF